MRRWLKHQLFLITICLLIPTCLLVGGQARAMKGAPHQPQVKAGRPKDSSQGKSVKKAEEPPPNTPAAALTSSATKDEDDEEKSGLQARGSKKVAVEDDLDHPGEAAEFFRLKRLPKGATEVPFERYVVAQEKMRKMRRYSTAQGRFLPPGQDASLQPEQSAQIGAWTSLGPGRFTGGRTRVILVHPTTPTTLYAAGVTGGVWKSTNDGGTWAPLTDLMANINVGALAMDPNNPSVIYAGTGESYTNKQGAGIFKTTDGGANWSRLAATNTTDFQYVNDIVVSKGNSQRVYAATATGVWRSVDGGANWTKVLNQTTCQDLAIRTDLTADYVFATCQPSAQGHIYLNTDAAGAGTWGDVLPSETVMGRISLAIAPSNQSVVYALAESKYFNTQNQSDPLNNYYGGLHAVFRSTSGGASGTWTARVRNTDSVRFNTSLLTSLSMFRNQCSGGIDSFQSQGFYDNVLAVDPANSDIVWAGGIGLYRSDDGGMNWGMGAPFVHVDVHAITFHPQFDGSANQKMYVGTDGGISRTTNARAATANPSNGAPCSLSGCQITFSDLNSNYAVGQFYYGLPYPDGATYFGGLQDNGVERGTDGGGIDGWQALQFGDGGYVAVDPTNTNTIYIETQRLSIKKATDGGANFNSFTPATTGITNSGFLFVTPLVMDPGNAQRLWTGGNKLWRTDNGAGTWSQASAALAGTANNSVSTIAVAPTDSNYVLAGTSEGFIHQTTVGTAAMSGTAWPSTQPRTGFVSWVTFDPTNQNIAYATYSTFGGTHVWKSVNAGVSWAGLDGTGGNTIPDIPAHCLLVDPQNTSRLFLGTDLGIFVSADGGSNWAVDNTGFANVITESLAINSGATKYLFAFTHGRGAWRVPISCGFNLSKASDIFAKAGGAGSVTVTAPGGCSWNVVNNNPEFITVTPPVNFSGTGVVNYTVTANPGTAARTGSLTIAGQTFTVNQVDFIDVPPGYPFYDFIHRIFLAGITSGCGDGTNYCPNDAVTRAQMAIFLLRGEHGAAYVPPLATGTLFTDVSAGAFAAAWIEQLANEGITGGCGTGTYCPAASVTRAQMAIFLLRAKHGRNYAPPPATGARFHDVAANAFAAAWIEQLANEGITGGCGDGTNYCPNDAVNRAAMAIFLARSFGL